jgi:hypothetical protein
VGHFYFVGRRWGIAKSNANVLQRNFPVKYGLRAGLCQKVSHMQAPSPAREAVLVNLPSSRAAAASWRRA